MFFFLHSKLVIPIHIQIYIFSVFLVAVDVVIVGFFFSANFNGLQPCHISSVFVMYSCIVICYRASKSERHCEIERERMRAEWRWCKSERKDTNKPMEIDREKKLCDFAFQLSEYECARRCMVWQCFGYAKHAMASASIVSYCHTCTAKVLECNSSGAVPANRLMHVSFSRWCGKTISWKSAWRSFSTNFPTHIHSLTRLLSLVRFFILAKTAFNTHSTQPLCVCECVCERERVRAK